MTDNLKKQPTFADFFCGIGGFHIGMERAGFKCVYAADNDKHACEMYEENFGVYPYADITKINPKELPNFDVLCAGFPCQTFSISGKQKGFYDDTRGTLFFDICRIAEYKNPEVLFLENVQNLEKHDKGRTLSVITHSLNNLGYSVTYSILNAKNFDVPQNRERIIIIGHKGNKIFDFSQIVTTKAKPMSHYLDKTGDFEYLDPCSFTLIDQPIMQPKSGLIFAGYRNKKIRTIGVRPGTEHLSRVHKQPNRIYSSEGMHPTIASQETTGRYFILHEGKVRKLTLNECFNFMGFPSDFKKTGASTKLYLRIGNSVCVNMVEGVGMVIMDLFFNFDKKNNEDNPRQVLEDIYTIASKNTDLSSVKITDFQKTMVRKVCEKEETLKGVYTVLVTSLLYKYIHPEQDVRKHQANMAEGYSGRSFDTVHVTPFLKEKRFSGAMKESGWLTRSLEQNLPYNMNYPGKISNKGVKDSFLKILEDIETNNASPYEFLVALFTESIIKQKQRAVTLVNPIEREASLNIQDIISYLDRHFNFRYKSRGASILPVIAMYSIYECILPEMKRYKGKELENLASHTSCDKSSGAAGDIDIIDSETKDLYEVVEVKFNIPIDSIMVEDAYDKIKTTRIQRYYILTTSLVKKEHETDINKRIEEIKNDHGCQIIINGVFPTLKYYLRLLNNTDQFVNQYLKNTQNHPELNYEHKIAWNKIMEN